MNPPNKPGAAGEKVAEEVGKKAQMPWSLYFLGVVVLGGGIATTYFVTRSPTTPPTVTAPDDSVASRRIKKETQGVEESPMVTSPAPSGSILAPVTVAAPPKDAIVSSTGLASKRLSQGTGVIHPTDKATVEVRYTGWTTDGKMFDSSVQRGTPAKFPLKGVIKGWTEGLQLMVVGEQRRFWIPAELAYGNKPGRPMGMLVFDVELLSIKEPAPEPRPVTPPDVATIPATAIVEKSGLASRVLLMGGGTLRPAPTSKVKVHYTGWTVDGKMFDSSIVRGEPITFALNTVIPGWTEGLQLMIEGEKRRFWIPEALAYKGAGSAPKGMLVFDVELLAIVP